ncbi:MAG TPA: nitroreductase family protein [Terriglobia bacterium]|nr:nitroreductase family protein [Terriglobia bacterium]
MSATPKPEPEVRKTKIADTVPGVDPLIRSRWSPRSFSSRMVSPEDLRTLFEAARWAASSYNEQPWRFLVATKSDPAAYQKILNLLVEFNQQWASTAPVLVITAAKKTFSHSGAPNRHAMYDAGAALAYLMLQATALGLHAHGMAGFDHERARQVLGIPDDYEVGAAVAIGYVDAPEKLPEQYRAGEVSPRQRKPLDQIVFGAQWEQPFKP